MKVEHQNRAQAKAGLWRFLVRGALFFAQKG